MVILPPVITVDYYVILNLLCCIQRLLIHTTLAHLSWKLVLVFWQSSNRYLPPISIRCHHATMCWILDILPLNHRHESTVIIYLVGYSVFHVRIVSRLQHDG